MADTLPWLRFYTEVLNDPKVQRLPDSIFKTWVNLLLVARLQDDHGQISTDIEDLAFQLHIPMKTAKEHLKILTERGLIENGAMHNWDNRQYESDRDPTRNERQQRYRNARSNALRNALRNGEVTRDVTDGVTPEVTESNSIVTRDITRSVTDPLPPDPLAPTESETDAEKERAHTRKKQEACQGDEKKSIVHSPHSAGRTRAAMLYAVRQAFEALNPQGFTDPDLESKGILGLADKFTRLGDADPAGFAQALLGKYLQLTQSGDKFWRGQPFTPSNLNKPGIFDRVVAELKASSGPTGDAWDEFTTSLRGEGAAS